MGPWRETNLENVRRRILCLFLEAYKVNAKDLHSVSESKTVGFSFFVLLGLFMLLRRPDALTNPQPWAEDGGVFILEVIDYSSRSLWMTYAGYFHFLPRVITWLAFPAGLVRAQFLMNLSSSFVGAFCISYFVAKRFRTLAKSDTCRYVACLIVAGLPVREVFLNVTNLHFFLLVYLILWASDKYLNYSRLSSRSPVLTYLETTFASAAFLSTPFGVIVAPVMAWLILKMVKDRAINPLVAVSFAVPTVFLLIQTMAIGSSFINQTAAPTLSPLFSTMQSIVTQVVVNLFIARPSWMISGFGSLLGYGLSVLLVVAFILFLMKKDGINVWLVGSIALFLLVVSVGRAVHLGYAERYVFIPMTLLVILLMKHLGSVRRRSIRILAGICLVLILTNVSLNFQFAPFYDLSFNSYAREFQPEGDAYVFVPINPHDLYPPYEGWYMRMPFSPQSTALRFNNMMRVTGGIGVIEDVQKQLIGEASVLVVSGWAICEQDSEKGCVLYLFIDDSIAFPASYGMPRPDLVSELGNEAYERSGWFGVIPIECLQPGPHLISLRIVSRDESSYYAPEDGVALVLDQQGNFQIKDTVENL